MWRRTAQPGLWFTAGSLAQCRIFSRYLALQILACESGLLPLEPAPDAPAGSIRPTDLADLWDGQLPGQVTEPSAPLAATAGWPARCPTGNTIMQSVTQEDRK